MSVSETEMLRDYNPWP